MRFFTTLPTNKEFFKVYARFASGIQISTYGAQIVSALTEIGTIYGVLFSVLSFFFPSEVATIGAATGAVVGTMIIEIGLRFFLPQAVDAFLYRRFRGLYLLMSVFIVGMTIALVTASGALSFRGSKLLIQQAAPQPVQLTTAAADSTFATNEGKALSEYRTDSTATSNQYAGLLAATRTAARSEIAIHRNRYESLKRKEQRTGNSYATKKAATRAKIAQVEAGRDAQLNELLTRQAAALAALRTHRRAKVDSLTNVLATATNGVQAANNEAKTMVSSTTAKYGDGLGWITIVFLAYLIVCIILDRVHRKGSGIEELPVPTDYHFRQSIGGEAWQAVNDRLNQRIRQRIADFATATAAPPMPTLPHALLSVAGYEQAQYNLPSTADTPPSKVAPAEPSKTDAFEDAEILENRITDYLEASVKLESENNHTAAAEMSLKAEQVIKTYLERNGGEAAPEQISELKSKVIEFVNEVTTANPFAEVRAQIGFKQQKVEGEPVSSVDGKSAAYGDRITVTVSGKELKRRTCKNCGNSFTHKHWNKQYCSDECRVKNWEAKHGRKLMLKKKK